MWLFLLGIKYHPRHCEERSNLCEGCYAMHIRLVCTEIASFLAMTRNCIIKKRAANMRLYSSSSISFPQPLFS